MQRDHPELRYIKSCCSFNVPDRLSSDAHVDNRMRRRNIGLDVLGEIALGLREAGYPATTVKPAIGIEAGFSCLLNKFLDISVLLGISHFHDGRVDCAVLTRPWRPIMSYLSLSKRPIETECTQQYERFLRAINDQIVNRLGAASVSWITEKELGDSEEPDAEIAKRSTANRQLD